MKKSRFVSLGSITSMFAHKDSVDRLEGLILFILSVNYELDITDVLPNSS